MFFFFVQKSWFHFILNKHDQEHCSKDFSQSEVLSHDGMLCQIISSRYFFFPGPYGCQEEAFCKSPCVAMDWIHGLPLCLCLVKYLRRTGSGLTLTMTWRLGVKKQPNKNRLKRYIYIFWCLRNLGVKNVFVLQKITNTSPAPLTTPQPVKHVKLCFMEASPRNLMMVPPVCTATLYSAAVIPVGYLRRRVPWWTLEACQWIVKRMYMTNLIGILTMVYYNPLTG